MKISRRALAIFAFAAAVTSPAQAQAQAPLSGPDLLLNSYTTGYQGRPAVAATLDGGFLVTWHSSGLSGFDVVARRFDTAAMPVSTEFVLSSTNNLYESLIAASPAGDFVVLWRAGSGDSMGQMLDSAGAPVGASFSVTTGQASSDVAWASSSEFAVVWEAPDGDPNGVFARVFDDTGAPLGAQFQVNGYTTGFQGQPEVAGLSDGNFVVAWSGAGTTGYGVFARRFDAGGAALGSDFVVNPNPAQHEATVAGLSTGEFVVAWTRAGVTEDHVFAQRFSNAGVAVGTEFQVNQAALAGSPRIVELSDGTFAVAWWGVLGQATPMARQFDASWAPLGSEFRVSSYTAFTEFPPEIAATTDGAFVLTWDRPYGGDASGSGVFGRVFCTDLGGPDADSDGVPDKCDHCPGFDDTNDADADGDPDACDICTNVAGARNIDVKPRLVLREWVNHPDRAQLKGSFTIGTAFSSLDPVANGARVIFKATGGPAVPGVLDYVLPPGAFDGTSGWKVNAAGTRYEWQDTSAHGLSKFVISDKSSVTPGLVAMSAKSKDPDFDLSLFVDQHDGIVVVGDPVLGECGETAFAPQDCTRSTQTSGLADPRQQIVCR
jgi:hypothetical protein